MLIDTILKDKGNSVETIPDTVTLAEAANVLDQKRIGAIVAIDDQEAQRDSASGMVAPQPGRCPW